MPGTATNTSQDRRTTRGILEKGLRVSLYGLIVASSFSIAGIEAATLVLFACALLDGFQKRFVWGAPTWLLAPFAAVVFAELLSAFFNPQPADALWNMRGQYRILLPFAMLPALALVDSRRCLFVLGGCVILSALYGIVQFHYGVDWFRLEADQMITPLQFEAARAFHGKGTFSHHLTYAGVLLLNALFFLALVFFERTRARWFWALVVVAAISGIVVSMGRSSWLGLAVGGVVLALKLPRRWSVALLGAGFALILAVIFSLSTGLLQRYVDTTDSSVLVKRFVNTSLASEKDRFYLWEAGWLGIVDRPVVGAGFGNPAADYEKYREIVAARHDDHRYLSAAEDGVHNVFLQIAYSTGVIGLAAFVWMFVALFVWCARRVRDAASIRSLHVGMLWGTAAGLVGTLVAGLFQNNYFDAEVQNMMGLMIGFALFAGLRIQEEANRNFRSSGVQSE